MVDHASLTGAALHEPKGVATATAKTVYVANGSGSGSWTTLDHSTLPAGCVVGVSATNYSTYTSTSSNIPLDDTIPQNTEGIQIMSVAHTPKASGNLLKIDVVVHCTSTGTAGYPVAALFKDSVANALMAGVTIAATSAALDQIAFTHYMTAGTTSAITFKVRVGADNSGHTTYVNGVGGGRWFGGTLTSTLVVTEFKV